ncbi:flagellar filament capping protein FliD [Shewanella corallii]|uniref:Flagellar hook-associated protein 2 n=1 Tax=Shewanella corallii TaxID=560080 RepID=A0ABT0N3S8_9GAMM|nr:flagellar filament capping protein FliD [Shewanella corallii]MCL2913121.1 flagellar filament capping protein FliD [Shewanella corallii]
MGLTATGIGSGLDITGIVQVLVDAEKVPKEAIFDKTEQTIESKVSAIGTLKSKLSTFQDALEKLKDGDSLNQRSVSTGDSSFFTAEATKSAQPGSYNIIVEQLAQANKVGGTNVADATAGVGEGSLDFTVNGASFSVDIASGDDLAAIASKVNSAADNVGITAAVVKSDAGSRLVFSSQETGTDSAVNVTATDTTGTGLNDMFGTGNLETIQDAKDSIIYIDGQKLTSQSNEVEGAISGVSLTLTDADLNETSTLTIAQDNEAVTANVNAFVTAYNDLISSIDNLSSYDADKKEAAALQGDSMIRSLESQLRNTISERVDDGSGSTIALYDIGISVDRYGKMSVDSSKLSDAVENDMSKLESLFSTETAGLANRLDTTVESYVKAGGVIDSRKNSYTSEQQRLDDQREAFARKMELLEARLLKQFNAMDLVVAQLNQQSAGLADRLNSLPGVIG